MVESIAYLLFGFVLLIAGADFLVRGASSLAKRMRISALVIGMTVVAFGTSMPEIVVNIMAAVGMKSELVFGNVIGSNIMNTMLILGVAGVITPIAVRRTTVIKEIPFTVAAVLVLALLVNDRFVHGAEDDGLSRLDALLLLGGFAAFMLYAFSAARVGAGEGGDVKVYGHSWTWGFVLFGCAGLLGGGRLVVINATELARLFGVSDKLIGLTIVSIGTSLPELATTGMAAYRRRFDIAVGNVVGSNIFNIMLVLGLSGTVHPVAFDGPFTLNIDLGVLLLGSATLFIFMFTGKKRTLDRWEAGLFLTGYAAYLVFLFWRG